MDEIIKNYFQVPVQIAGLLVCVIYVVWRMSETSEISVSVKTGTQVIIQTSRFGKDQTQCCMNKVLN
jgi:hypothetical protein